VIPMGELVLEAMHFKSAALRYSSEARANRLVGFGPISNDAAMMGNSAPR
jgi:hypothetical protein